MTTLYISGKRDVYLTTLRSYQILVGTEESIIVALNNLNGLALTIGGDENLAPA